MFFLNRRSTRASSGDGHHRNARNPEFHPQAPESRQHRRNTSSRLDSGGNAAAPKPQHQQRQQQHQQPHTLSEHEQLRRSFQNPFATAKRAPLGSAGKRAHVRGQEHLPVSDFTGESNRADEPGTGWRLLQALDELRWRDKNMRRKRDKERDIRVFEQQGRKKGKEAGRERRARRYSM